MSVDLHNAATDEVETIEDGRIESPQCSQRSIEMLTLLNDVFDGEETGALLQTTSDTAGS
jgi:hypothetical protein